MSSRGKPDPVVVDGKTWGCRVKERRVLLGMTQETLAQLVELEQQTISKIEKDEIRPRDRTKEKLAAKLGTHVGALFPWPRPTKVA